MLVNLVFRSDFLDFSQGWRHLFKKYYVSIVLKSALNSYKNTERKILLNAEINRIWKTENLKENLKKKWIKPVFLYVKYVMFLMAYTQFFIKISKIIIKGILYVSLQKYCYSKLNFQILRHSIYIYS